MQPLREVREGDSTYYFNEDGTLNSTHSVEVIQETVPIPTEFKHNNCGGRVRILPDAEHNLAFPWKVYCCDSCLKMAAMRFDDFGTAVQIIPYIAPPPRRDYVVPHSGDREQDAKIKKEIEEVTDRANALNREARKRRKEMRAVSTEPIEWCLECDKPLFSKGDIIAHLKLHSEEYTCDKIFLEACRIPSVSHRLPSMDRQELGAYYREPDCVKHQNYYRVGKSSHAFAVFSVPDFREPRLRRGRA